MIRRLVLAAALFPLSAGLAQQAGGNADATSAPQEIQVPVPTSRIAVPPGFFERHSRSMRMTPRQAASQVSPRPTRHPRGNVLSF